MTSKPDLYPLVISYNGDTVVKTGNGSTGYLMVQYFRNFIGRPPGKYSFLIVVFTLLALMLHSLLLIKIHY